VYCDLSILGYLLHNNAHFMHMCTFRLGPDLDGRRTSSLFTCAICQLDLEPSEGISVHAGSIFSSTSRPWEGPFLCSDCREKKDAMEGKRPSGVKVL
jgi:hypothetical protein